MSLVVMLALAAAARGATTPSLYVSSSFGFSHPTLLTGYAAGNAAPLTNVVGSATGLLLPKTSPSGVCRPGDRRQRSDISGHSGRLFVANANSNSVTTYASGATGNATPLATLSGTATKLAEPTGLGFDATGARTSATSTTS